MIPANWGVFALSATRTLDAVQIEAGHDDIGPAKLMPVVTDRPMRRPPPQSRNASPP